MYGLVGRGIYGFQCESETIFPVPVPVYYPQLSCPALPVRFCHLLKYRALISFACAFKSGSFALEYTGNCPLRLVVGAYFEGAKLPLQNKHRVFLRLPVHGIALTGGTESHFSRNVFPTDLQCCFGTSRILPS